MMKLMMTQKYKISDNFFNETGFEDDEFNSFMKEHEYSTDPEFV